MYLEKLEIQGFKSFANKNKLVFSGIIDNKERRGITVVVGPNGSGKSNIADAIRWVLGEQSSKLLRSKKSEDVIFSGSDKKGRLNMAEVSLFLNNEDLGFFKRKNNNQDDLQSQIELEKNREGDNIDALLMLPEIVLTRKIFRDGNSEYYINNSKVRLSDVQIFLAKANFGQKTYSVIGQGMVENFLNTSPAERKAFFDEATGVKQYQIKRDLSLNKLELSQENLSKIEMLLNEIEPRLKSLTRQVGKLKKRQSLEEELLISQLNYYSKIWQEIELKISSLKENISGLEFEKKELETSLSEKRKKLEYINQGETVGEEFYDLQKRFLFLKSEQERAFKQLERISLWQGIKKEEASKNGEESFSILNQEKQNLLEIIEKTNKSLDFFSGDFSKHELLRDKESLALSLERDYQEKNRELSKIEAWIEVKLEKQGKFDLSFLKNKQSELNLEIPELKNSLALLLDSTLNKQKKLEELKSLELNIEKELSLLESELSRAHIEESPSNIQKINQGLKNLIKKIEENIDLNEFSLFKKIVNDINIEIKELLSFSSGDSYRHKIESISSKISDLKNEKNNITKNLSSLQLEINIEKGRENNFKNELIKKERDLIDLSDKITLNEDDKGDDFIENKKKKEKIEKELAEINNKINLTRKEIIEIKLEKDEWQNKKSENQSLLQRSQNNLNELNNKLNLIKTDSIKVQSKLEDLEYEIKNNAFLKQESLNENSNWNDLLEKESNLINSFQEKTKEELTFLQEKIDNFNQEQENKKRDLINLQNNINELSSSLSRINSKLGSFKIDLAREETRVEDLESNILDDKLELEKIKSYKVDDNFINNNLKDDIYKLKNQLEMIGGIDPETEKEYEETKKRFDFLSEQTDDLNKTIKSLEKVIIELDTVIKNKFDLEFKLISEKFNEYFKILFNGGNAKIFPLKEESLADFEKNSSSENSEKEVVETRDSLALKNVKLIKYLKKYNAIGLSGVDISATPPGKKISSVNMLSGGERALTAIALICAIISANPSPFVVLDEVDAALDEANSERLAKILDDLSSKTQFIAISHNRATMKKANILYGVTMQSDGISKLLSVKLEDNIS